MWNEMEAIRPAWERILQGAAGLTIFSTLEWLGAWWKAFAKDKELVAPVFSNADGEIVGVVPLYAECVENALPFRVRRLRLVGDGSEDSDNLDLIVRIGYETSCAQAFLSWLESNPHWDICELNTLPLDSASLPSLICELKQRRWTQRRLERPRSRITLPDSWESYLKQIISRKEKTKIGYYTNRLMKRFHVSISKCDEVQAIPGSLATLFGLHQKRWQLKGRPGAFASAARRELYYDMAASFAERGWLEFWILQLEGKPVAAQYGFRYRDVVYSLQEGFNPEYSSDRVGYVLRAHVLKTLMGQGVRHYDFLGHEDSGTNRWGAEVGSYADIHFARPLTRGAMYLRKDQTTRALRRWFRTKLPGPILRALPRRKSETTI
ncbi:MAG: GNAT family N-acetyltransferase [Candidatus Acidiferrum sp.]|jgi:CelD/BcsL family acetyltransferase involved in cellulose biosynthesis